MSKEAQDAFVRFGILVEYISAAEHHLNLVEWVHHSLWDIIRAIRMDNKFRNRPGIQRQAPLPLDFDVNPGPRFISLA